MHEECTDPANIQQVLANYVVPAVKLEPGVHIDGVSRSPRDFRQIGGRDLSTPRLPMVFRTAKRYKSFRRASRRRVWDCVKQSGAGRGHLTKENTQSKGRIRRSLVFDAFPCQPHFGLSQVISSSPKIFIASTSDSAAFEHFRCRLMLCPPLGHAKTILYALLIEHHYIISDRP